MQRGMAVLGLTCVAIGLSGWSIDAAVCEGVPGGTCQTWDTTAPLVQGWCCTIDEGVLVYKSCSSGDVRSVTKTSEQCGDLVQIIDGQCTTRSYAKCGGAHRAATGCTSALCAS
jgi:hypothetical protein